MNIRPNKVTFEEIVKAASPGNMDISRLLDQMIIDKQRAGSLGSLLHDINPLLASADTDGSEEDNRFPLAQITNLTSVISPGEQVNLCLKIIDDLRKAIAAEASLSQQARKSEAIKKLAQDKMTLERLKYEVINMIIYIILDEKFNSGKDLNAWNQFILEYLNEQDIKLLTRFGTSMPMRNASVMSLKVDQLLVSISHTDEDLKKIDQARKSRNQIEFEAYKQILITMPGPFATMDTALRALLDCSGFDEIKSALGLNVEAMVNNFDDENITKIINTLGPEELLRLAVTLDRYSDAVNSIKSAVNENQTIYAIRKLQIMRILQQLDQLVTEKKQLLANKMLERLQRIDQKELSTLNPFQSKQFADVTRIIETIYPEKNGFRDMQKEAALNKLIQSQQHKIKFKKTLFCINTEEIIKYISYISVAGTPEAKEKINQLNPCVTPAALDLHIETNSSSSETDESEIVDKHPLANEIKLAKSAYSQNLALVCDPDGKATFKEFCHFYLYSKDGDIDYFAKLIAVCNSADDLGKIQFLLEQSKSDLDFQKIIQIMIDQFSEDKREKNLINNIFNLYNIIKDSASITSQLVLNCIDGVTSYAQLKENILCVTKGNQLLKRLYMKYDSSIVDKIIRTAYRDNQPEVEATETEGFASAYQRNAAALSEKQNNGDGKFESNIANLVGIFDLDKFALNDDDEIVKSGSKLSQIDNIKEIISDLSNLTQCKVSDINQSLIQLSAFIQNNELSNKLNLLAEQSTEEDAVNSKLQISILLSDYLDANYDQLPIENKILITHAKIHINNSYTNDLLAAVSEIVAISKETKDVESLNTILNSLNMTLSEFAQFPQSVDDNTNLCSRLNACTSIYQDLKSIDNLPDVNVMLINSCKILNVPNSNLILDDLQKFSVHLKNDTELKLADKSKILSAVNKGLDAMTKQKPETRTHMTAVEALKGIVRSYSAKAFVVNLGVKLLSFLGLAIKPAKAKSDALQQRVTFFKQVARSANSIRANLPRAVK